MLNVALRKPGWIIKSVVLFNDALFPGESGVWYM